MEMHHKLRRDPSWDPRGCNICGQLGHQAAMCPNGNTVNWRQVYGDDIFKMRPAVLESDLQAIWRRNEVDLGDLEKRAREYAKAREDAGQLDLSDMARKAQEMMAAAAPPTALAGEPLPEGWAEAKDPSTGKPYFYHKETKKVTWDRPTADTPTS